MWRVSIALVMVLSFSLMTAVPVSAGTLTGVSATTDNSTAGATANYTIDFTTATSGNITTIVMAFATEFNVSGATLGTVTEIGAGSIGISGDNVTYTVSSPVEVADNVSVSIGLSNIVNPTASGSHNITITTKDDLGSEIDSDTASVTIDPGPIAHFSLATEHAGTEVAGTAFSVNVTAQDQYNNTATSYNGTAVSIAFTSTATAAPDDTSPTIPTPQSLNFSVTPGIVTATGFILVDAGETPTITASDDTYSGTSAAITVNHGDAASLGVTDVTDPITKGASSDVTVTAYDAYQNVATSYNGTIAFTSTDTAPATLPSNYTFVPVSDNGTHTFTGTDNVTFNTVGQQSVTATDNVTGTITGTQSGIGVYDKLITLKADGWTLISTDKVVISSGATTSTWEGTASLVCKYASSGYLTATFADLKPVEALYVKMTGSGQAGLNYSGGAPVASSKSLIAGWNLISIATTDNASAVLSPLRHVQIGEQQGVGLTTLVSQGNYNQSTGNLYLPTLLEGDWTTLGTTTLDPFDGYWVYMNAAKSFGVIPQ